MNDPIYIVLLLLNRARGYWIGPSGKSYYVSLCTFKLFCIQDEELNIEEEEEKNCMTMAKKKYVILAHFRFSIRSS